MTGKLTKSQSKYIKSLQQKKYRDLNGKFIVEGIKLVQEALKFPKRVDYVVYVGEIQDYRFDLSSNSYQTSPKELSMISSLKSPNKILAVCNQTSSSPEINYRKAIIALDEISDPGNLGTIIRLADWFGISQIVCAPNSVDQYNPKVVQATMGSIFNVAIITEELTKLVEDAPPDTQICIADMKGDNLYEMEVRDPFILIMGSESHGVSDEMRRLAKNVVSIPQFGGGESLNVAVSAGIILSEFKRKLSS